MSADLLLQTPAGGSTIVLGEEITPILATTVAVELAAPTAAVVATKLVPVTASVVLEAPTPAVLGQYRSQTERPLGAATAAVWGPTVRHETGRDLTHDQAQPVQAGPEARHRRATPTPAGVGIPHARADRVLHARSGGWAGAIRARAGTLDRWEWMLRDARPATTGRWGLADSLRMGRTDSWWPMLHDRRPSRVTGWGRTDRLSRSQTGSAGPADRARGFVEAPFRRAIRPPGGSRWVQPPAPSPCYTPDGSILLWHDRDGSPLLLFVCDRDLVDPPPPVATLIIPAREVYMTVTNATLRRVADNLAFEFFGFTLSIDVDSWTYTWSASLPAAYLAVVQPVDGDPVELEATVNGHAYRVLVERITRDRTFPTRRVTVGGRGLNAALADPHAPTQQFGSALALSAAQVADSVLTLNGVGFGWSVDWGLDDWDIPANVWSHQGTYQTALQRIAEAAGGYVQPHPTAKVVRMRHRYPTAPWDWAAATPDVELPDVAALSESIEWVDRAAYNRVFVSGARVGVLGQVTRAGTAGDILAPMVTDDLVTSAVAARQRGRTVLSNTGRQATITLRLPWFGETGLLEPGKLVRYLDGATARVGIVRAASMDVSLERVRQTVSLETHVS